MTQNSSLTRIHLLLGIMFVLTGVIILRLFYLQVWAHGYYEEIARTEQYGYTKLPARRGEILLSDSRTGDDYQLATNTTLNMVFADPTLINDPDLVTETLAPLLFDLELEQERDQERIEKGQAEAMKISDEILRTEALSKLQPRSDEELADDYKKRLKDTLSKRTRDTILITEKLDEETRKKITALRLAGVEVTDTGDVLAYPAQISNKANAAKALAEALDGDTATLKSILEGKNRYVELKHRISPEVSDTLEKILKEDRIDPPGKELEAPLHFLGIRMKEEYFRYYPEESLAAQVLGYVNSANGGQYGVEGSFDDILRGKDGIFTSQIDAYGKQITVGDSVIEEAVDGADITLTLDRAIQLQVERYLEEGVKNARADNGEAIVVDPNTGHILAMAQYPTFNPNQYGDVFKKKRINLNEDEKKRVVTVGEGDKMQYWFYQTIDPDYKFQVFPDETDPTQYWMYENEQGPEVYKNRAVQDTYEPGSVFKPLVMAMAINAGEVSPSSTFNDSGPIPVDFSAITKQYEYEINTFNNEYFGIMTMTQVLEKSSNTGMTFVVRKLGAALFYSYLKAFGFLERSNIGLADEGQGSVSYYETWRAESEMITKAFGQGLSLTPIQLVQAYTSLANGGKLMRLQIVKEIDHPDGRKETFEPEIIRQVITPQTSKQITAMLTSVGENYVGIKLPNHYLAAKTGTAQTYKRGRALSGPGTTMATVMSFGPVEKPQFLVLVKMDKPRLIEWAESTSGPVSRKIMEFLYDYYSIPPDKKTSN